MSTREDVALLAAAEADAAAYREEVARVIGAQRQELAALEKQAQQLAQETAAEQRYSCAIEANKGSAKISRLQAEHSRLSSALEREGKRGMELSRTLEAAQAGHDRLRDLVTRRDRGSRETAKRATGPMLARVQRRLAQADEARAEAARLRQQIDHLRKERLIFLDKLRDLELQIEDQRRTNSRSRARIASASSKRENALGDARRVEDSAARVTRQRAAALQHMHGLLHATELQSRQARSRLRERMAHATNAATQGGAAHRRRSQLAQVTWPPANDREHRLVHTPMPRSLREVVETLRELLRPLADDAADSAAADSAAADSAAADSAAADVDTGGASANARVECGSDLESLWSAMGACEARHAQRLESVERLRRECASAEESNGKARRALESLEATGGTDPAEAHALREQLTVMNAKAVEAQLGAEHRAAVVRAAAVECVRGAGQLERLEDEPAEGAAAEQRADDEPRTAAEPRAGTRSASAERDTLAHAIERLLRDAELRLREARPAEARLAEVA